MHIESNLGLEPIPPVDPITTIIFVGGIAVTGLRSLLKRFARGNYQKFRREYYDDFLRKARSDNKSVTAYWFGEGVQVQPDGDIDILGKFDSWLKLAEYLKTLAGCKYGFFFGSYTEYCFGEPPVEDDDELIDIVDIAIEVIDWLRDRGRGREEDPFIGRGEPRVSDFEFLNPNLPLPEAIIEQENSYWWIWLLVAGAVIAKKSGEKRR